MCSSDLLQNHLGYPVHEKKHRVPLQPDAVAVVSTAKKLAASIAPYLREGPRTEPEAPKNTNDTYKIFLCPSAGSAEDARQDLLADLQGSPEVLVASVAPCPNQMADTFQVALAGIQGADLSVHFFGVHPKWSLQNQHLNLLLLETAVLRARQADHRDRKSTRLNSSHLVISYAVFCL